MSMELRTTNLEIRVDEHKFSGYAARFYNPSDPGTEYELIPGRCWERINQGAFNDTLRSGNDVMALYHHDVSKILGRTNANTLRLWTDQGGLRFELDYDGDDADHRNLKAKLRSKAVAGCSFGFTTAKGGDRFFKERGRDCRELLCVELKEITMTPIPAYGSTQASFRSADGGESIQEYYDRWVATQLRLEQVKTLL